MLEPQIYIGHSLHKNNCISQLGPHKARQHNAVADPEIVEHVGVTEWSEPYNMAIRPQ